VTVDSPAPQPIAAKKATTKAHERTTVIFEPLRLTLHLEHLLHTPEREERSIARFAYCSLFTNFV